jgi:hypothetical protein
MAFAGAAFAQTVPNGGMESWRNNTSGSSPVIPIHAPIEWYGFDSLIISFGEMYGPLIDPSSGSDWKAQLFEESTIKNSGAKSAKLMTLQQDVITLASGILSNANVDIDVPAIIAGADPATAVTYSGGTPVTLRINTVSAWVEYFPGIDTSTGLTGVDTGLLTVQAISTYGGQDSIIGIGVAIIPPCSTFTQITANVIYSDTTYTTDLMRIIFSSSGGSMNPLDSSTLYIDDVSMAGSPQTGTVGIRATQNIKAVHVYPNPASDALYFEGGENLQIRLASVNGQAIVAPKRSDNSVDVSALPSGLYFYTLTDASGAPVQRGKVVVAHK